jgi:hypothetical protein
LFPFHSFFSEQEKPSKNFLFSTAQKESQIVINVNCRIIPHNLFHTSSAAERGEFLKLMLFSASASDRREFRSKLSETLMPLVPPWVTIHWTAKSSTTRLHCSLLTRHWLMAFPAN